MDIKNWFNNLFPVGASTGTKVTLTSIGSFLIAGVVVLASLLGVQVSVNNSQAEQLATVQDNYATQSYVDSADASLRSDISTAQSNAQGYADTQDGKLWDVIISDNDTANYYYNLYETLYNQYQLDKQAWVEQWTTLKQQIETMQALYNNSNGLIVTATPVNPLVIVAGSDKLVCDINIDIVNLYNISLPNFTLYLNLYASGAIPDFVSKWVITTSNLQYPAFLTLIQYDVISIQSSYLITVPPHGHINFTLHIDLTFKEPIVHGVTLFSEVYLSNTH